MFRKTYVFDYMSNAIYALCTSRNLHFDCPMLKMVASRNRFRICDWVSSAALRMRMTNNNRNSRISIQGNRCRQNSAHIFGSTRHHFFSWFFRKFSLFPSCQLRRTKRKMFWSDGNQQIDAASFSRIQLMSTGPSVEIKLQTIRFYCVSHSHCSGERKISAFGTANMLAAHSKLPPWRNEKKTTTRAI